MSQACQTLDEDEKGVGKADTLRGKQDMMLISESGLYSLIIRSNKPEAKVFRKWVASDRHDSDRTQKPLDFWFEYDYKAKRKGGQDVESDPPHLVIQSGSGMTCHQRLFV